MKNKILFILIFGFSAFHLSGQEIEGYYFDVGIEIQQYPTGFLLGIRSEVGLSPHNALDLRLGYNLLDHQDFGVHESEIGGGFGGSVGYRHYFKSNNRGFFLGIRTDLWWNEVDWKDNIGTADELSGTTNIIVLQPTAIGGYRHLLNDHWVVAPTLAFGAEFNMKTKGAAVGEGPIFLWGINLAYRFF